MKIKELFNFEDIEQVIAIGNIENQQEMVEKFVISPNLKDDLLEFLEYLKGNKPEKNTSINVIGNYGTGKSHLLSFLSIILSNSEMVQYIQDEEIKEAFSNLTREFIVVKYELPGQDKTLEDIFFYRVRKQLKENYGIEIRKMGGENDPKDPKELIEEILFEIKEKYPTKGLIVIFDEYSDFLKSKESSKQNRDLQFTRQIAECSKDQDFILMLSMQEYIFSNPAYKDKADLINKIEKRFLKFNITSENIEDIIAKRMVTKSPNQVQEIKNLFVSVGLEEKFPNIALEEDRYVKLFPVHPYLIEMLSNLTLFENRSILTFISQQTKKIQEKEFPAFITYDLIYDSLIESEHTIKNNEMVKPIIPIVNSLRDIVPRLDEQYRERAYTLIEALAIKNLVTPSNEKGDRKGGDTPEKFAENLCIIPKSKFMDPSEDIGTILNMLISQSEGQFISKDKESNTYFINLNRTTDYEQLINNKASTMDDLAHNNEVFVEDFLLNELGFEVSNEMIYAESNKKYVLEDTVKWTQRNSFKEGTLAINIGNKLNIGETKDFLISIKCFGNVRIDESHLNHIIIKPQYTDEFKQSIRRLAAVNQFLKTKTHTDAMRNKKRGIVDNELKKSFKDVFGNSIIKYKSKEYTLEDLGINNMIISETFSQIKEKLLGEDLVNQYPEYPKFKSNAEISKNNIKYTIESVVKDLANKTRLSNFDLKSNRILIPLGLLKDDVVDVNNSDYASLILNEVENSDKNIAIEDIVTKFESKPYGIQKEITYLVISVLLRNGNLMISNKNGKSYSSAEFGELFKPGLIAFRDLKYIRKEEGPGPQTQELFDILDLDKSLLEIKKNHSKALQVYIEKYDQIMKDIKNIRDDFNQINFRNIGLPLEDLENKIKIINNAHFEDLEVSNISGFNKLEYSKENLEEAFKLIKTLKEFFNDYESYIYDGIKYMNDTLGFIDNNFFKSTDKEELTNIYLDSMNIISNSRKLLKTDERRPLEGKIQQFKDKYKSIYYDMHENFIGNKVEWDYLNDLEQSEELKLLRDLKDIRSINPTKLRDIQFEIQNIKALRCSHFNVDDLNNTYHCTCMFPRNMGNHMNINKEIEDLWENTTKLTQDWEKEIIKVVSDNENKLAQLEPSHQEIIQNLLSSKQLPKNIDFEFITAINNLLDDIEIKEVSINELFNIITNESDTLKVNEIVTKVENYLKEGINDTNKARIRLVKNKEL